MVRAPRSWLAFLLVGLLLTPAFLYAQQTTRDPLKAEILERLERTEVSLEFENTPLEDVVQFLRTLTGLNIIVDSSVYEDLSPEELTVTITVTELSLRSSLRLMLGMHRLTMIYDEGVLIIMPKRALERQVFLQIYDVRDLMFQIQDFPGPEIYLADDEDSSGTGIGGFDLDEGGSAVSDPDFLVEVIMGHTGGDSWDEVEGASVTINNGLCMVVQSAAVHREVRKLINLLRQFK